MFTYRKTSEGYMFSCPESGYEARRNGSGWDLYCNENDAGTMVLIAEGYASRDAAARDAYDMDMAVIRARVDARAAEEAKTPAATALRQAYRFQSGGSRNAIENRRMAEMVEAALAEAVEQERVRVWRAIVEDGDYETVMGGPTIDGEAPRAVLRVRTGTFRTILFGEQDR